MVVALSYLIMASLWLLSLMDHQDSPFGRWGGGVPLGSCMLWVCVLPVLFCFFPLGSVAAWFHSSLVTGTPAKHCHQQLI